MRTKFSGQTSELAKRVTTHWLLGLRESNPAILDMFKERDLKPYRDLLPWSGEFSGKYLTSCYTVYRMTGDEALKNYAMGFARELVSTQAEDGYLGPYAKVSRLTGNGSPCTETIHGTWDAWGHYHNMLGLYLWHEESGEEALFAAVLKAADLLMQRFYGAQPPLSSIGWCEMNLAPAHIFALLYQKTKEQKFLDFALHVMDDLEVETAGDYLNMALAGIDYYASRKPRWEAMHILQAIAALYDATGDARYKTAATQIFQSILKTDVHNTGAFSTGEQAVGHPYGDGAIETCCVVAFNAFAVDVLKLTDDSRVADFLEISHYNAVRGMFSPSGRWSTYDTPMDGVRRASIDTIHFQCRPGSPELNCCSVNAPRALGMPSQWAVIRKEDTVLVNFYESFHAEDEGLTIDVSGEYPVSNRAQITVRSEGVIRLGLRIPRYSVHTAVTVDGETSFPTPEGYFYVTRAFAGETITVEFDFTPQLLAGGDRLAGKVCVYVGPVLMGADAARNRAWSIDELPALCESDLCGTEAGADGRLTMKLPGGLTLTDFYHLGESGSRYRTWLDVK